MKTRYCVSLSLDQKDFEKTEKLRKQGRKLIEIYRKGLDTLLKNPSAQSAQ